jgi:hypothetical protein
VIVGEPGKFFSTNSRTCLGLTLATSRLPMTLSSTGMAHFLASAKGPGQADEPDDECQASAGATVKDQPGAVSNMSRNSVTMWWPE